MPPSPTQALEVDAEDSGRIRQLRLYGRSLLVDVAPCQSELWVNGTPLELRPHQEPHDPARKLVHLKGERFVDHFSGWGLVVARRMGQRAGVKHPCLGIQTLVRRELCDQTIPTPGPGGPVVETPLFVDTFSVLNWNWSFWGDDTRMIFSSTHAHGPDGEWGHVGHEHDTPERVKHFLKNVWRRIYPGCLLIHGGLFYDAKSGAWLAITCRQPQVGYILNIANAGRGVGFDFTLHSPFALNDALTLPEIRLYYGPDSDTMMRWLADYATFYYEEPPEWVHKKLWSAGLSWNNQPTWADQAAHWEKQLDDGQFNAIGYSLVTNRPIHSGTTPTGYEPDPAHGTVAEFKAMCHRMADRDVPVLIWMSHSGLCYRGGPDLDDDWFIRGIDGRICASWGSVDGPELAHINPGHPGYIEYTKKWIRFYISDCRCKGIFFDCMSWAFPPDFAPRRFMRYPGDTNLMTVRFMREVYAEIKRCDPQAIMLGEGATLEGPINVVAIGANPVREGSVDGYGPRDFLLSLNRHGSKWLVVDQGPRLFAGSGYCHAGESEAWREHNRYLLRFLAERGGRGATTPLPGDLSILHDGDRACVVVAADAQRPPRPIQLPTPWNRTRMLTEVISGDTIAAGRDGIFPNVPPGIYRLN